mmetsp:Transcript_12368/g.25108  ORF Transcript_12368/g.25108 Transcript_12368/m.25108 type:complete len:227 (+) Transcript_12368:209-889(+)
MAEASVSLEIQPYNFEPRRARRACLGCLRRLDLHRAAMGASEKVHDEVAGGLRGVAHPIHGRLRAVGDALADAGGHVAELRHGRIPALLRDVLAQHRAADRKTADDEGAAGGRGDLGASAPLLLLFLVLGRLRLVLALDICSRQGRGRAGGDRHEHGLAHLGGRRDVHGDELALLLGVGNLDRRARCAGWHGDAESGPARREGLLWCLPLVRRGGGPLPARLWGSF